MKKTFQITAICFITFVAVLLALFLILPDKTYSVAEKRNLEQFPAFSLENLVSGDFMNRMEDYSEDQFPYRDQMMSFKSGLLSFLGQKESQNVYLCEGDRLAEKFIHPGAEDTAGKIQAIASFVDRYTGENKKNAPRFYFLLAPTACSVYQESLPKYANSDLQETYYEELATRLQGKLQMISLWETFSEKKETMNLYYRTDHHWTTQGAYAAYQWLAQEMDLPASISYEFFVASNSFRGSLLAKSGFSISTPDEMEIGVPNAEELLYTVTNVTSGTKTSSVYVTEKLSSDDPYQVFLGGNYPLLQIETEVYTERKLLVIKDSYANALIPYLLADFSQITVVDPRYYYDDLDALMGANYTDVLFLYNINTFSTDNSLVTVLNNEQ